MDFRQEYILASEPGEESGKVIFYKMNPYLKLFYIDIRSRRIPPMQQKVNKPDTEKDRQALIINYSFKGKCEFLLKNGGATYLDTEEYAIACDDAVLPEQDAFYYPRAEYYGLEFHLYPCRELDQALALHGMKSGLTELLGEQNFKRKELFIAKAGPRTRHAMENIVEDMQCDSDKELLMLDVSRVFKILGENGDGAEASRAYYSGAQVQIARKAMDILTEDLSKRYSAGELAKKFGISETSLKNYFKGVYGRGYSELLNEIRMKKAAELIAENKMKISQVSDAVGFATQSRFARAFKKYFGVAPLEYKRTENLKDHI